MKIARSIAGLALAVTALTTAAPPLGAQSATGFVATWNDREIWTHATPDGRATEVGVGLQPTGPEGTMPIAFLVRYEGRLTAPPTDVIVQVAVSPGISPNVLHTPTLTFLVGKKSGEPAELNWSSKLLVDQPGPGANIQSGVAHVQPAEFQKLLTADALGANLLGIQVQFRIPQLDALRAFATRVMLVKASGAPDADGRASSRR
jgi:hypothetical protein